MLKFLAAGIQVRIVAYAWNLLWMGISSYVCHVTIDFTLLVWILGFAVAETVPTVDDIYL